jgi:tetratricopeptide (TPR) repeat protein
MTWQRGITILGGVALVGWCAARPPAGPIQAGGGSTGASALEQLDRDIAFFTERAERDPESALDLSSLAARYLQRARETGSEQDNLRAEEAACRSLKLRRVNNGQTYAVLASSLLAQHRFPEALAAAHQLVAADSTALSALGLLGEVYLELGHYDSARVVFGPLRLHRDLAIAPRLARWAELTGHLSQAGRILDQAIRRLPSHTHLRPEQVAWFHLRRGEVFLKQGRLRDAERAFHAGLRARPDDHRLLAAVARLELLRGRPQRAIEYADRSLATMLDPATLGVVADAYGTLGDSVRAEEYQRAMEVTVTGQSGPFHRAWGQFLLDHDQRVAEVLARAEEEIRSRRDVYGHDLLAWALYKQGRLTESAEAMGAALALGTEDASLSYHAGVIHRALGNATEARRHLEQALALNPYFHPTHPKAARRILAALDAEAESQR